MPSRASLALMGYSQDVRGSDPPDKEDEAMTSTTAVAVSAYMDNGPCTEPGGNEMPEGATRTQHEMLLILVGYCPWCGDDRF